MPTLDTGTTAHQTKDRQRKYKETYLASSSIRDTLRMSAAAAAAATAAAEAGGSKVVASRVIMLGVIVGDRVRERPKTPRSTPVYRPSLTS